MRQPRNPLVNSVPMGVPYITCELYLKWYCLWVVHPSGTVVPLDSDALEAYTPTGESSVGDHCFNPRAVQRMSDALGWETDDLSMELITGRWLIDHEHYLEDPR